MDYEPDEIEYPECMERGGTGPAVFCYSGCRDDQTSLDVTIDGKSCGALTSCWHKAFRSGAHTADYATIFKSVNSHINDLRSTIPRLNQCPQFSYSYAADPTSVKFCQPGSRTGGYGVTPSPPGSG